MLWFPVRGSLEISHWSLESRVCQKCVYMGGDLYTFQIFHSNHNFIAYHLAFQYLVMKPLLWPCCFQLNYLSTALQVITFCAITCYDIQFSKNATNGNNKKLKLVYYLWNRVVTELNLRYNCSSKIIGKIHVRKCYL